MDLVIFGARAIALGTYNAIKKLYPERNVECFLVTLLDGNAKTLGGIPVRELEEYITGKTKADKDDIEVLIATPENVMEAIEKSLDESGLYNHVRIDSQKWAQMQELAFIKSRDFTPLSSFPTGNNKSNISLYKMVHHKDKPLQTVFNDPDYVFPIQVGAALTDKKVALISDNTGDNISDRNGNYSELTGLYWMWKNQIREAENSNEAYYGPAHYRRFLELSDDDLSRLSANDIDVVLPYPMPYEPNIEEHHKRYLSDTEWSAVLQALNELQPQYAKAATDILHQGYLYNYNIVIAKAKVLADYCEWLFPILFRIEEINDPKGEKVPNRYIGYIGETLETLYFMYNRNRLKIAHAGCRFLS